VRRFSGGGFPEPGPNEAGRAIAPRLVSVIFEQFSESREEKVDRRRAVLAIIAGQSAFSTLYFLLLWLL
jgi:hypothetical protein